MSDLQHWGSAHDRAELDAFITRGDDREEDEEEDETEALAFVMPTRPHPCHLPLLQEPGGRPWTCPDCGAEWRCNSVGADVRLGMWQRTFAEQTADAPVDRVMRAGHTRTMTTTTTDRPPRCFVVNPTSTRKPHNDEAGYLAECRNPLSGGHTVVYEAAQQGIDVDGDRYAVVCCVHATLCGSRSMRDARLLMHSAEFCEACMAVENAR